jgi:hypothetical protein
MEQADAGEEGTGGWQQTPGVGETMNPLPPSQALPLLPPPPPPQPAATPPPLLTTVVCCTPPLYRSQQAANGEDPANKAQGKKEDGTPAPAPGAPAKAAPGAPAPVDTPAGNVRLVWCRVTAQCELGAG